MAKGKVKWYDEVKGFGFIQTENGEDIFVHRTGLADSGMILQEDDQVEFETKKGDKGLFAVDVTTI